MSSLGAAAAAAAFSGRLIRGVQMDGYVAGTVAAWNCLVPRTHVGQMCNIGCSQYFILSNFNL